MHSTLIRSRTSEIEGTVDMDWDTVDTVVSIDLSNCRYEYKDKLKKAKAELDKADKDDLSATKVR